MRYFDMSVLGKFAVIMADPPWDIHMEVTIVCCMLALDEKYTWNIMC